MDQLRFKPKPPEISASDPFKEDLLERKKSAESLTTFVGNLAEPFVLAIDSPWGTGKSTFLRMWLPHLKNSGFFCLYFNAWENDFSDSPLVSLIAEIGNEIESLDMPAKDGKRPKELFEKTKKTGAKLLKAALPTAVKLATAGMLDLPAAMESDIGKLAEDLAKKQIEKYQADKKSITGFKKDLTDLVKALAKPENNDPPKPVVFVIDELDRCRPNYAIELLEKIKHLFSVEGLVFVLAIDREQLGQSVRALYGGIDADGYLRRFIDLDYRLQEPDPTKFAEAQFERFGLNSMFEARIGNAKTDSEDLKFFLPKIFQPFKFSLRTQEQCFTQLLIVLKSTPNNSYVYAPQLVLLICLRAKKPILYRSYCNGESTSNDVLEFLRSLPGGIDLIRSNIGHIVEANLIKGNRDEKFREMTINHFYDLAKSPKAGDPIEATRVGKICEWFSHTGRGVTDMTAYLYNKIEMAHRFV